MSRNTLDTGVSGQLDVKSRQGSLWRVVVHAPDTVDLTTVTGITVLLKKRPGGFDAPTVLTFQTDITQKASGVLSFHADPVDTAKVPAGSYAWELQLTATDDLDGRGVAAGEWHVEDRWPWRNR